MDPPPVRLVFLVFTRVASEAKRAKRAERNEVERVCGGKGGVPSASWSLCLFVCLWTPSISSCTERNLIIFFKRCAIKKFEVYPPAIFRKIFQKFFKKFLKFSKKNFFSKNFRDYTHMKEYSSGTPNMQKISIFDHPSSSYGSKRA